ncbi:MAG: hypothetical protein IPM71_05285 [Bacteroidota bacterium]|nr:MAG: hypothetical protein IPM71_05285 [Bacteroidota bacterium]
MKSNHFRNTILFSLILFLLLFPLIQRVTKVFKIEPLKGYIKPVERVEFTKESFFDDSFQMSMEAYEKRNIGFQPDLVRINNQLEFDLFNKINAATIVRGQENHFYGQQYIDSYYGSDYLGDEAVYQKTWKLLKVQEVLKTKGVHLCVVVASSKSFVHPQYLPVNNELTAKKTNYESYRLNFDSLKINYIDFLPFIKNLDDTSAYSVHPKTGIHWSYYATYFVVDSLRNYMQQITGIPQPEIKLQKLDVTNRPRNSDKDIEDGLNLLYINTNDTYAYPNVFIDKSIFAPSLRGLVVADSYYYTVAHHRFDELFADFNFWFYYNEVYPSEGQTNAKQLNLKEELEKRDVIFILVNVTKLQSFAWGFIDDCYALYCD